MTEMMAGLLDWLARYNHDPDGWLLWDEVFGLLGGVLPLRVRRSQRTRAPHDREEE